MKRTRILQLLMLGSVIALLGCHRTNMDGQKALNPDDMDLTVDPGDDFYEYANGGWIKKAVIPADRSMVSEFTILNDQNEEKVKQILFDAKDGKGDTTNMEWQKLGALFASGLDTASIEKAGYQPIKPDLDFIALISSHDDLSREFARERPIGGSSPFYVSVTQDSKEATKMILSFYESGLGMPDRDYYLDTTKRAQDLRAAYQKMLLTLFKLVGYEEARAKSMVADVFDFETKLARASYTRVEMRNPQKMYNKLSKEQMKKNAPNINWELYFQNLGVEMPDSMLVNNPGFFHTVSELIESTPINIWKDYLTAQYIIGYASVLSKPFETASFEFYGKALSGQTVQRPRWKRVSALTQSIMGMAVGKAYVAKYFPPAAKERMLALVANLRATYRERMGQLTWMSEETRKRAQEKLDAITVKIGYPDKWRDYTDLSVAKDSYALNVRNGHRFNFNYVMSKLGKPVDRTEWGMTPQTVNAYYSPNKNEIVFPAGILQPPFFNMKADDAVNYGAIGVVIGHEITHGFDDQGRQYTKDGNLHCWWSPQDSIRFTEYTKLLVDEFNAFEPLPGQHVNGALTLGENLADYGGLTISLAAFQKVLDKQEKEGIKPQLIDGFTPYQRFFLAYARVWRNRIREQEALRRLKEDVHSPGKFRVDGAVYNIDGFYKAFNVKKTSPYYRTPDQRPTIW